MSLQREIYKVADKHGFHEGEDTPLFVPTKLALIMSECVEALEAHRAGKDIEVGHELADVVIRTYDLAESLGVDLDKEVRIKHKYNKARPYKHGDKKY